jgi:hypothetical protein
LRGNGKELYSDTSKITASIIKEHGIYITGKIGVGQFKEFTVGDGKEYPTTDFESNCNKKRKRREGKLILTLYLLLLCNPPTPDLLLLHIIIL